MGCTETGIYKRKQQKRKNKMKKMKNLKNSLQDERSTNKQIRKDLKNAKIELATIKKDVLQTNENNITSFKKYFFVNRKASKLCDLLPRYSTLSEEVVTISDIKLGEGTFGVVYKRFDSPLNVNCAIKVGKSDKYFDVYLEAKNLQLLQSSRYFPRLFGIFSNKLVLEYVHSGQKVKTLLSEKKESSLSNELCNRIFYQLADAVKFMHKSNLLHNDIKTNNVLLKGESLQPILIDMGKVTSRHDPVVYNFTESQKNRYNQRYSYLAYELRNLYGSKTSTASDIFSLGFIFQFISNSGNNFLLHLSKQMLTDFPCKRIQLPDVLRSFGNNFKVV